MFLSPRVYIYGVVTIFLSAVCICIKLVSEVGRNKTKERGETRHQWEGNKRLGYSVDGAVKLLMWQLMRSWDLFHVREERRGVMWLGVLERQAMKWRPVARQFESQSRSVKLSPVSISFIHSFYPSSCQSSSCCAQFSSSSCFTFTSTTTTTSCFHPTKHHPYSNTGKGCQGKLHKGEEVPAGGRAVFWNILWRFLSLFLCTNSVVEFLIS